MTRPHRNFRFKNKTEAFVCVGFRYDEMNSLEYVQRKDVESIVENVRILLKEKGADVISIRRIYLPPENQTETKDTGALVTNIKPPESSLASFG